MHVPTVEPLARGGRVEALARRLYAEQRQRLLGIARRNCDSSEDAEEALQDAFILFIEHFDPEGDAPPLAWLALTLKRRCWALAARRRRQWLARLDGQIWQEGGMLASRGKTPQEAVEIGEEIARRGRALGELKRDEQTALLLLALGYSYQEICARTGWTYTKVNRCVSEGRAALRGMRMAS